MNHFLPTRECSALPFLQQPSVYRARRWLRPMRRRTIWPIAIFEKVFEGLNYQELAEAIEQTGADGIEATIRKGGHIEPAVAEAEVPKMNEALKARGRRIIIAATSIARADDPDALKVLKTLKANGIDYYRMSHYQLKLGQPLLAQVRNFAAQARELAALNKRGRHSRSLPESFWQ